MGGGVLEHPAFSKAWNRYMLPIPTWSGWRETLSNEWVCEVWQSAYGHKARKRTWLYYYGAKKPLEAKWDRNVGTHQVGQGFGVEKKPVLSKREAAASPLEFAQYLISLAEGAAL